MCANWQKPLRLTAAGFFIILVLAACQPPPAWFGREVSGIFPDLEFSLVGSDGQPADAGQYHGKVTLLYFGFTNCPGVCPTTLGHIKVALNELGETSGKVQALLVSVDPKRDTPEAMKTYTAKFGPWLHGLTGEEADLRAMNNAFKVNFTAQAPDAEGRYEVVHSNAVFAFDAEGKCRLLLSDVSDPVAVASDLRRLVRESGLL